MTCSANYCIVSHFALEGEPCAVLVGLSGLVCAGETQVAEQEAVRAGRNPISSTEQWAALLSPPARLLTDMSLLLRTDVPVSQSAGGMWGKHTPGKAQRGKESEPGECESTELCSRGRKPEIFMCNRQGCMLEGVF